MPTVAGTSSPSDPSLAVRSVAPVRAVRPVVSVGAVVTVGAPDPSPLGPPLQPARPTRPRRACCLEEPPPIEVGCHVTYNGRVRGINSSLSVSVLHVYVIPRKTVAYSSRSVWERTHVHAVLRTIRRKSGNARLLDSTGRRRRRRRDSGATRRRGHHVLDDCLDIRDQLIDLVAFGVYPHVRLRAGRSHESPRRVRELQSDPVVGVDGRVGKASGRVDPNRSITRPRPGSSRWRPA